MFMVMTSLISDFSSVLLDVRDKNLILSKPVNNITLNMAKIIHIVVYLFFITFALIGPAMVVGTIRHGIIFFLLFFVEIILLDFFIVALTALLYLVILRFFDGEKLKDVINYVQIGLSIVITVGFQFVGRLFNFIDLNVTFQPSWWQYFVIPAWFGAPFEIFIKRDVNTHYIILSALALVIPILSICLYIKLIPVFERNLQKLNNQSGRYKKKKGKIVAWIATIVCSSKEERTFFQFATKMVKNEREFKLRVYPTLGFAFVFPFIFLFTLMQNGGFNHLSSSNAYFNIYFCAMFLPTVILMMRYSANYKGAWIYKVIPIHELAPVFKGTLKACLVNLLLPIYVLECIIFTWIFGVRIIPDLIVVLLNIFIYTVICFKSLEIELPFTRPFEPGKEGNQGTIILLMLVLGILFLIHFLCKSVTFGIYIYIPVALIINVVLWRRAFNISWKNLEE
jgi:cytochrome b561